MCQTLYKNNLCITISFYSQNNKRKKMTLIFLFCNWFKLRHRVLKLRELESGRTKAIWLQRDSAQVLSLTVGAGASSPTGTFFNTDWTPALTLVTLHSDTMSRASHRTEGVILVEGWGVRPFRPVSWFPTALPRIPHWPLNTRAWTMRVFKFSESHCPALVNPKYGTPEHSDAQA